MSRSNFIKFIKSLDEDELRKEMTHLYSSIKDVKQYYSMELGTDTDRKKIYDKAKVDIRNLYYIRNKPRKRPRIQKIKTILKSLEKIAVFTHETIDINLYTCGISMEYLSRRPSTTQAGYNNCLDTFKKAMLLIQQVGMQKEFEDASQMLIENSASLLFIEDELVDAYNEAFKD